MNKAKSNVLLLGDAAAGKSTLLHMYTSNGSTYLKDYNMTQGVDIQTKIIFGENNEKDVEFYFFDAGGHPIYKPIIEGVFKNIDFVILVFDCTSKSSFEYISKAYDEFKKINGKNIPGVVVATKRDLKSLKSIDFSDGAEFAKHLNMSYFETSCLKNHDVEKPFQALREMVLHKGGR